MAADSDLIMPNASPTPYAQFDESTYQSPHDVEDFLEVTQKM
jgi:hypothetical protein